MEDNVQPHREAATSEDSAFEEGAVIPRQVILNEFRGGSCARVVVTGLSCHDV